MQVRLRDFDVVAKDGIEFDFERRDAGAAALALLDLRQHLLAVAGQFAQLVEVAIDAGGDDSAVSETQGRLGNDGLLDARAQIVQLVERRVESGKALSLQPRRRGFDRGNPGERCGQREHIPRIRGFERYPAEQALQVEDAIERAAQLFARDRALHSHFDRVQPGIDFIQIERRPQQPRPQQTLAHGRDGGIDGAK